MFMGCRVSQVLSGSVSVILLLISALAPPGAMGQAAAEAALAGPAETYRPAIQRQSRSQGTEEPAFAPWGQSTQTRFSLDRLIVKLRPEPELGPDNLAVPSDEDASLDKVMAAVGGVSAQALFPTPPGPPQLSGQQVAAETWGLDRIFHIHLTPDTDVQQAVETLATNPHVEYAEPDYLAHTAFTPDDPRYPDQWGLPMVDAGLAWDVTQGSPAVAIAILDTGIDLDHPDLASKLWVNPGEIPANGLDDDANGKIDDVNGWDWVNNDKTPQDDIGHGTHVAGVAAGATNNSIGVAGVCPNCRLMSLKVLDATGQGTYSNIAQGITYAANKGAKVINLSLGGYADSSLLRDAVAYASQYAVVVAAVGNDNRQDRFYPAAYDEYVIGVAATDNLDQKAVFSNYGDWVDISAPGVSIWSTLFNNTYGAWSGSSMAVPFVSGAAGLVRSQYPSWSAGAARGQLLHSPDALDALNPGYEGKLGFGRLNASQAVTVTAEPELAIITHSIDDVPEGTPEPGDTVSMKVTLQSTWADAADVTATLTTTDTHVTVTDDTAVYGAIDGYETKTNDVDTFAFTVGSGTPYKHLIPFELALSASGGYAVTMPFSVTVASGIEYVSGVIDSSATWTSDTTYVVTGNTLVPAGVILTIDPGTAVVVNAGASLEVTGALRAIGADNERITFACNGNSPCVKFYRCEYSVLEECTVNGGSIVFDSTPSEPLVRRCQISGSPTYAIRVVSMNSSWRTRVHIQGNTITGNVTGIDIYSRSSLGFTIDSNVIANNEGSGIQTSIWYQNGGFAATHNLIANNGGWGIYADFDTDAPPCPQFERNTIMGNTGGIAIGDARNAYPPVVANSNLVGNPTYMVVMRSTDINAAGNWWGTSEMDAIQEHIHDYYDDYHLGKAVVSPALTGPELDAPPFLHAVVLDPVSPVGVGPAEVNLEFSKPMSMTIQPTVAFGLDPVYDTHIVLGDWISSTRWVGTHNVTFYTGDGLQRLWVSGAVGADDGMEIPEDTRFTFEIATIGATSITAEPGYSHVALSWTPSDLETTAGYNLYRGTQSGGPYTRLNSSILTTTSYSDTNVANGTPYYYVVKLLTTDLYEMDYGSEAAATPNDYTPPSTPAVTDDGVCTPFLDRLHASWSADDPDSGITEYQYSIGSWAGGTDVTNWTSVETATQKTKWGLSLVPGVTYYFNVKAKNGVGMWGGVGSSDGIIAGCPPGAFLPLALRGY